MEMKDDIHSKSTDERVRRLEEAFQRQTIVSVEDAAELGISRMLLSKWVHAGKILRVARGRYQSAQSVLDDLSVLLSLAPRIAASHESALYLNGLSSRCPVRHSITVPTGTNPPSAFAASVKAYYVQPGLFDVGLDERKTASGVSVPCYDAERTICDVLRSRSRIDVETLHDALRRYAGWGGRELNRLSSYARIFRLERVVSVYMGALL
jgi:predicted transcriptional regulator of viral defense system